MSHPLRAAAPVLGLAVAAAALAASFDAAPAQADVMEFYKGKTAKVVVGFSPGGGFDAYGRLVARHIGKYIPGKPNFVVNNLPGASGLKAVQSLKAQPADGTVMVIFNAGNVLKSLTDPKKVKIKFTDVAFLGSVSSDMRVCYMWHKTGIKSWDDLVKRPQVTLGATSKTSGSYLDGALIRNVFGVKVKQIIGYPGSAEQRLAIERGELDGDCGSYESIPEAWIKGKLINVTHRNSKLAPEGVSAPYIIDLAKTDEQKKVLSVVLSINDIFRPFVVSRQVPADRLKALRAALMAVLKDKAFMADAEKSKRTIVGAVTGEEADAIVAEMYRTPPALIKKAAEAIE
ncbi:MAG: Bug family tripartite tricarboxylate transporter substrate binding protein [Alphaproteobacteria bacterium]